MTERRKKYGSRIFDILLFFFRRRQSRSKSAGERSVQLDDIKDDSQDPTSSTSNVVYQNVGDIRRTIHGNFSLIKVKSIHTIYMLVF